MAAAPGVTEPQVLFYALGGGLGHVARGLALARKLLPMIGVRGQLLTNSPFASALEEEVRRCSGLSLQIISPEANKDEVTARVKELVAELRPVLFVVDTFPRGLAGELAEIIPALSYAAWKVLIGRNLPEEYAARFGLRSFVEEHFQLVLVPGEKSIWEECSLSASVPPILIRERSEVLSAEKAAKFLRLEPRENCVLIVGSGTVEEICSQAKLLQELSQNWPAAWPPLRLAIPPGIDIELDGLPPVRYFPLSELFSVVRVFIGSAGYHLVHEARRASIPLIASIQPRLYDDQRSRVNEFQVPSFATAEEVKTHLATLLARSQTRDIENKESDAGASLAAQRVAALIAKG
jgi:hypothetical protein